MAGQTVVIASRAPWYAWLESLLGRFAGGDASPRREARAARPPRPAPASGAPTFGAPTFGARGWERVLDVAREELGALSIFAVDPRGLVIASRGSLRPEHVDELAAGLLGAFERSARLGAGQARAEVLRLELGRLSVTGYFPAGALLVGIVARDLPLDRDALQRLRRRFDVLLEVARVERRATAQHTDGGAPDAGSLDGRPIAPESPASGLRRTRRTHHTDEGE